MSCLHSFTIHVGYVKQEAARVAQWRKRFVARQEGYVAKGKLGDEQQQRDMAVVLCGGDIEDQWQAAGEEQQQQSQVAADRRMLS